jgi:dynein heavy chain
LIEKSKQAGEKQLLEKREKVIAELEKLRQRVDEFNDYGELDMMTQYVQDVRAVQKRLSDVQEQISFINKVSPQYRRKIVCQKKCFKIFVHFQYPHNVK